MLNCTVDPETLSAANISPQTGLATDYLNHFNEVAMLIDMLKDIPDMIDDVLDWQPLTYEQHFQQSGFREKELAMLAYHASPEEIRTAFLDICSEITETIKDIQSNLRNQKQNQIEDIRAISSRASELFMLISQSTGIIHGGSAQSAIDAFFD